MLLPIGYHATVAVSKHYTRLASLTRIPVAPYGSLRIAAHKDATMAFAAQYGVRTPKTYRAAADVDAFPVVVKGTTESRGLRYVNSPEELARRDLAGAVVQEYVPGVGYGFYALYCRGEPRSCFMHRRIREYPITGGPSTAAESLYDERLRELGQRLLTALQWHGVAMVEFKRDARDGEYTLMEINPKFWGSLDLSLACGVDFPYRAIRMAMDGDIERDETYRVGVRYHWLFPDEVLHVASNPRATLPVLRDCFNSSVRGNIDWRDPGPTLFQVGMTAVKLISRAFTGSLRRPHGTPRARS